MNEIMVGEQRAVAELVDELLRQEENCRYTAASLHAWTKFLRACKVIALICQATFGALATWKVLTKDYELLTAVFALLSAIISPLLSAIKLNDEIERSSKAAAEFAALRDRFRRAALVDANGPYAEFKGLVEALFDRMDKARALGMAVPEPFFLLARRKIRRGDYSHDYDQPQLKQ